MPTTDRLTFAYLAYTSGVSTGYVPVLMGVYKSIRAARSWFDLVEGEVVSVGRSNLVMQKFQSSTDQIWYVEKHVIRDVT